MDFMMLKAESFIRTPSDCKLSLLLKKNSLPQQFVFRTVCLKFITCN